MATQNIEIQKCSTCKTKKPLTIEFYNKKQSGFFNKKCINCNNINKKSKLKSKETIVVWKATEHNKRNLESVEIQKIRLQNELDGLRLKNSKLRNFCKQQKNPVIEAQLDMIEPVLQQIEQDYKDGNIKL